jgi:hypothetical protein
MVVTLVMAGSAVAAAASPAAASPVPWPGYFTVKNTPTGYCLGIVNHSATNGTVANSTYCSGTSDQIWHWGYELGTTGYFQLVNSNNKCLGVSGGSLVKGTKLVTWDCLGSGHTDQYWQECQLFTLPGSDLCFANYKSNQVIGVYEGSTAPGALVVQWTIVPHMDQSWYVTTL